jgi:hypothetical protein
VKAAQRGTVALEGGLVVPGRAAGGGNGRGEVVVGHRRSGRRGRRRRVDEGDGNGWRRGRLRRWKKMCGGCGVKARHGVKAWRVDGQR